MNINFGRAIRGPAVWADFDNDGDLDVLLTRFDDTRRLVITAVWRNDGNEVFTEVPTGLPGVAEGVVSAGDIDRDGWVDVAISGAEIDGLGGAPPRAQVFRNVGNLQFAKVSEAQMAGPMSLGDYDRDGDLDLLHAAQNPYLDTVHEFVQANDGLGNFSPVQIEKVAVRPMRMQWVDFDVDGELDAVFNSSEAFVFTSRNLLGYRNRWGDSAPNFLDAVYTPEAGINGYFLSWADVDGDGDVDAIGQKQGEFRPYLLRNQGGKQFAPATALLEMAVFGMPFGDADNDGDLDAFIISGQGSPSRVGFNDGEGNITLGSITFPTGSFFQNALWADYDRDGDLDIFYSTECQGDGCQGSFIFRNDGNHGNTRPAVPQNVQAVQLPSGDLNLQWTPATDAESTNPKLLTYEVRVGTSPGAFNVIAPGSDPVSGFRKVAALGAERAAFRLLRNLPKGTYYWSVQSVDTVFAGSAWTAEQSFTVTNTPPIISRIWPQSVAMSAATTLPFEVSDAESLANSIVVSATSENNGLIPEASLIITGTGSARTITFRPTFGKIGTTRVILLARDPHGLEARTSFEVKVEEFSQIPIPIPSEGFSLDIRSYPPADYDGDGDLDLYLSGQRRGTNEFFEAFFLLFKNDGGGRFSLGPDVQYVGMGQPPSAGDFDHDGDIDVLSTSALKVNNGDGTFTVREFLINGTRMIPGDVNGDGKIDMVTQFYDGNTEQAIYLQRGETWEKVGPISRPQFGLMELQDFDHDGDLDFLNGPHFIGPSWSNSVARLFINSGAGLFTETRDIPNVFGPFPSATDDDSDGDLDLISWVEDPVGGQHYYIRMTNDGRGNFAMNRVDRIYGGSSVDYDHDGDLDYWGAVTENFESRWYLFRRDGDTFTRREFPFSGSTLQQIGDFDNDGDLDFIGMLDPGQVHPGTNIVFIRNNTDTTNRPPQQISGLVNQQTLHGQVTLSWSAAPDDHTPPYLLSYNLRVGTTPGGIDVFAPHGRIAQEGNIGKALSRSFYHLPPGTYYWSVQGVDGQYQQGTWSHEKTFVIDGPGIAFLPDISTPPNTASRPIAVILTGDSLTSANALVVTASSENTNVIAQIGLAVSGSGTTRALVITPLNRDGEAFVRVTATGFDGRSFSRRFLVVVRQFAGEPLTPAFGQNSNMQWIDADSDHDLDLISLADESSSESRLTYWENSGAGELRAHTNGLSMDFWGRIYVGDRNGDNDLDLFLTGYSGSAGGNKVVEARFWEKGEGGKFEPRSDQLTNNATLLGENDQDQDGIADVTLWSPRNTFGVGAGRILSAEIELPEKARTNVTGIAWSDLDGDGDLDLVFSSSERLGTNETSPFLGVWSRDAAGMIPVETDLPTTAAARITTVDVNGDRLPDIIVSPLYAWDETPPGLWRNLGNFRFEPTGTTFRPRLNGVPAVGDFDNDGDPDLAMTSPLRGDEQFAIPPDGPISIYRNDGSFNWGRSEFALPQLSVRASAWGDADDDGDLDLAVGGDNNGWAQRTLYRNNSFRSNTPPAAPSGLAFSPRENGVLLNWIEGSDSEDARFLTYNLRIGATPGGSEILSAAADPVTGRRRNAGVGNGSSVPEWRVYGLPNGTYFWAVQATDAGYASSEFSSEASFTISRPEVQGLTNLTVRANAPAGPFSFRVMDNETPAGELNIVITSSDESLIRSAAITLAGTSTQRSFQFVPEPHRSGRTKLHLRVEDGDGEVSVVEIDVIVREEFELIAVPALPALIRGTTAWGDADHDGDFDLFVGGWLPQGFEGTAVSTLWRNNSGILASNNVPELVNAMDGAAAFADADNDSKLDLLVTGSGNDAYLYMNVGSTDGMSSRRLSALRSSAAAWGDLNSDGKPELFLSGQPSGGFRPQTVIYRNQLPTNFSSFFPFNYSLRDGGAIWFDMDGDGDDDLVANGNTDEFPDYRKTALALNLNGTLQTIGGLPDLGGGTVAVADYNLDSAPDILITGSRTINNQTEVLTQLFENKGSAQFTLVSTEFPAFSGASAAWADYDGDGDPDLLLSGSVEQQYKTQLWINHNGRFELSDNTFAGQSGRGVAFGDVDNDGDLDLALVGARTHERPFAGVFRNIIDHGSSAPPVPINLRASSEGVDVILSWTMPVGSPQGLTFNIRAGSSSGIADIVSPMADLATGTRLVPAPGNASWSFRRRLRGFAGRPLFWSVQAINPAFQASAFAPEHEALVPRNESPIISPPPLQIAPMNQTLPPLQVIVIDPDNDAGTLNVTFENSNTDLFPSANFQVERAGEAHQLTLTPALNRHGNATITIRAQDPLGAATTNQVRIVVRAAAEMSIPVPQRRAATLAPADFDANGVIDLFFSGWEALSANSGRGVRHLFRNVDGQLEEIDAGPLPGGEVRAVWGDVDRDGDLDIVAAGALFQNNNSIFTAITPNSDPMAACAWGDTDLDGDLDLVVAGGRELIFGFMRNTGGVLSTEATLIRRVQGGSVAFGDPDNDGDLDLAVSGAETEGGAFGTLRIYSNDGGVWTERFSALGARNGVLQWADADRDGRADLLMAGVNSSVYERLFMNKGSFAFQARSIGPNTNGVTGFPGAFLFDFDNDGDLDLAEHTSSMFQVRPNDGTGEFSLNSIVGINVLAGILQPADFDRDGDFDLLVGGRTSISSFTGTVKVYRNLWIQAPVQVSALTAAVVNNTVELSWPTRSDFHPDTPVTYNLRVGTASGRGDVLSPLSVVTGQRLVAASGNAGFANHTRLRQLAPGRYYWSVQPISSSWQGGTFAPEGTFTIISDPALPVIVKIEIINATTGMLTCSGAPGCSALVEISSDLDKWTLFRATEFGINGMAEITFPIAASTGFFRVRCSP